MKRGAGSPRLGLPQNWESNSSLPQTGYDDQIAVLAPVGPDGSLENYVAGQPFAMDQIDCKGDPQAAAKIIWNFNKAWNGDGADSTWSYTYWDRGEQLPGCPQDRFGGVGVHGGSAADASDGHDNLLVE